MWQSHVNLQFNNLPCTIDVQLGYLVIYAVARGQGYLLFDNLQCTIDVQLGYFMLLPVVRHSAN